MLLEGGIRNAEGRGSICARIFDSWYKHHRSLRHWRIYLCSAGEAWLEHKTRPRHRLRRHGLAPRYPDVREFGDSETKWQINWRGVASSLPSNGAMKSKRGDRLWIRVARRDCSSHCKLYMTEQNALDLACVATAEECVERCEDGNLVFRVLASVTIRHALETASKPSQGDGNASVPHFDV